MNLFLKNNEKVLKNFLKFKLDDYLDEISLNKEKKIKNYTTLKINRYFPKLDRYSFNILQNLTSNILYHLMIGLNIETDKDNCEEFLNQISLNNDRNFLEIFNLFFPYIDDKNNFEKQKKVRNFLQVVSDQNNNSKNPFQFCNYIFDHSLLEDVKISTSSEFNIFELDLKNLKNLNIDSNKSFSDENLISISHKITYSLILDSINSIRYKLYINWLNIFPINLDNYKNTNLYKNSFKLDESDGLYKTIYNNEVIYLNHSNLSFILSSYKDEIKNISIYEGEELEKYINQARVLPFIYSGINVEDIYNTFSCDYYYSIKRNKWLLFEISYNNKFNLLNIKCLDDILNLENIINGKNFNLLKKEDKDKFSKNWKKLLDSVKESKSIKKFTSDNLKQILTYLVSYFEFHYNGIRTLEREQKYIYLPGSKRNTDFDPDEEEIIFTNNNILIGKRQQFTVGDILSSIEKVPPEDIYNFIFNEINELKNTIYKDIIIDENNILKDLKFSRKEDESYEPTPKNYYNFGKSLNLNKNERMTRLWNGLSVIERDLICFRLNTNEDNQKWFNIGGILKKFNISNVSKVNKLIYKKIRGKIIDLTFENLIKKGCISIYEINPSVTDTKIITNDYTTKKKNLEKNLNNKIFTKERTKQYENAFYYATNEKYKNMDKIVIKNNKVKDIGNLEHDSSQIKLSYLEYLKSPTITGDLWYSFYAMDWACQINFFIKLLNKRVTFVTGATGQGKSTQVPKLYLYGLKSLYYKNNAKIFCTAPRIGPVLENSKSISKSLGLPIEHYDKMYDSKVKTLNSIVQYQYANDKHVDINSNYFLRIMTDGTLLQILNGNQMLKQKISFNNENKFNPKSIYNDRNLCDLVIIDEAHEHNKNMDLILTMMKYTLFYNNDMKLSIISATMDEDEPIFRKFYSIIDDNLLYPISTYNLYSEKDRNFLDRRYHISPPGESTQYKIDEYYEENSSDTYEYNEELAINRISQIFKSSSDGDILTFSTTQKKIYEMANKLNKIIPSECLTLPYYSKLSEEYQLFSKEADSKVKEINIDRDDLLLLFDNKKTLEECKKVNKGTYKRCCIIATNAAEASLTITSLKYVVDIGFQLRIKYNYDKMQEEILDNEKITEASRLQRKGRVGRVRDGTVYYMYPKDSRIDVKSEYNISSDNFSDTFKDLLVTNISKETEVIPYNLIKKLLTFRNLDNEDINKLNRNSRIIYDQYKLNDSFYDSEGNCIYIEYRNSNRLDNLILKYYFPTYTTGFSQRHLLDTSGHFYLIHPLESSIRRDLMSQNIINENDKFEPIESKVITKIFEEAVVKQDIISIDNELRKNSNILEYNDINLKLKSYKSDYLKLFSNSLIYDENKETSKICIFISKLLELINYDISNLLDDKTSLTKFNEINKIYSVSDIEYFIKLYNDLSKIIKFEDVSKKAEKYYKNLSDDLIKFIDKKFNITTDLISSFCKKFSLPENTYLDILKLTMKGDLSFDAVKQEELVGNYSNFNEIVSKSNLSKYCNLNYLSYEIISSALSSYLKEEEGKLNQDYSENIKNLKEMNIISKFKNIEDKVINCFTLSYFQNTYYFNEGSVKRYIKNQPIELGQTLLKNMSSLGFYLNINKKANILTNINKEILIEVAPFFIIFQTESNKDYFNFEDLKQNISELTKKLSDFSESKTLVKVDNLDIEDKNFLNILMKQVIEKPNSLTGGGINQFIGKISKNLLNSFAFKKVLGDINLNNYNYGYVNLVNNNIQGLNLIEQKDNNCIVKVIINDEYLNKYTKTRLLNRNQNYILK